jgi:hypothetical protein
LVADPPEIGRLAMQLFQRWTVPSLIACLLSGGGWCALVAQEHPHAHWLYGIALAALALVGLNVTVGRRAVQLYQQRRARIAPASAARWLGRSHVA